MVSCTYIPSQLAIMAGTFVFLLLAVSLLSPVTPHSRPGMSKEWQNYLEHLVARRVQEHVWFDHLDETPEERILWREIDHSAASSVKEDQELSLRQLSHARRPSLMDYRIRI